MHLPDSLTSGPTSKKEARVHVRRDVPSIRTTSRIAEFVGQRDLTVTANTYTHVLVDEAELDYAALLN